MRYIFVFLFIFIPFKAFSYNFSYVPKIAAPTIYNFTNTKREKCTLGTMYPYPKRKGVCASCEDKGAYLIDDMNKAVCALCPESTLLVSRKGYPMCLSDHPVFDGIAKKPNDLPITQADLGKIVASLSVDIVVINALDNEKTSKTFKDKSPLQNACSLSYPIDPSAKRQVATCQKLGSKNDFLCPYVQKNNDDKWICRACPKNAPYKNNDGGCFNCPYGEEMVLLENGETVCASDAPPTLIKAKKIVTPPQKKKAKTKKRR